jgi:hypothetical protein
MRNHQILSTCLIMASSILLSCSDSTPSSHSDTGDESTGQSERPPVSGDKKAKPLPDSPPISKALQRKLSQLAVRQHCADMHKRVQENDPSGGTHHLYVQLLGKNDPDRGFFADVSTDRVLAKKYSQSKVDKNGAVLDITSGARGSRLTVQALYPRSDSEIEVSVFQYYAPLGGGESLYLYKRIDGKWTFKSKRLGVIS